MPGMRPLDAFTPAYDHMVRLLFRPFDLRKWLALGFVAMFASASGGRANYNRSASSERAGQIGGIVEAWITEHLALIIALVVVFLVIGVFFAWLSSVFKFVYINQITRDPRAIREPFARFKGLGTSFFLWSLAFGLIVALIIGVLFALPLIEVFDSSHASTSLQVIAVLWAVFVGIPVLIAASVIMVFAQDFVIPIMYQRNVKVMEGWRIAMPILRANVGPLVVYILMLIVIAIGGAIFSCIVLLPAIIPILIPAGIFALVGYAVWMGVGAAWTTGLIAYAAVAGFILALALAYCISVVTQPLYVFRRSYALAVLGQADPGLALIPLGPVPPPAPPYTPGTEL